mmetsp:Transcript_11034/g.23411  ORF Transcript_11034/g.23411 Transcript_11034/m.23411 type:complete len:80 (-) Transcript_11034:876-1115(-)
MWLPSYTLSHGPAPRGPACQARAYFYLKAPLPLVGALTRLEAMASLEASAWTDRERSPACLITDGLLALAVLTRRAAAA